jgi:uncharacterized RDD family membrane protein YckC
LLYKTTSGFPFNFLNKGYEIELWVLISMSLPVWLYFIYCELYNQQTVGKRLLRLIVMNKEGSKININQALIRTLIRLLPWELTHIIVLIPKPWWSIEMPENQYLIYIPNIIMILYIIVLFAKKGDKGFHDFIAKTRVKEL